MRSLPAWSLPLAVVLTLVLAGGFVGAVDDTTLSDRPSTTADSVTSSHPDSVVQLPNSTSYLRVPPDQLRTAGYRQVGVDVPGALSIDSDRLQVQLTVESFEQRFDDAATAENRTAAVRSTLDELGAILTSAQRHQRDTLQAFNRGEVGSAEFFRAVASSEAVARAVQDGLTRVETVGDSPLDYSLGADIEARISNMDVDLLPLRGQLEGGVQLRQKLRSAVTGISDRPLDLYVETGDDDVVLATIFGSTYLRESFIGTAYDPTSETDENQVLSRIQDLYDWAFRPENYVSPPSITRVGETSVHVGSVTHRHGQLNIYFDANTNNVFLEEQGKQLSDIGPLVTGAATNESMRLTVNATHETGPMELRLTAVDDGSPLDGTVFVDGARVGTTGDDGSLWVVDTRGDTTLRVEHEGDSVSLVLADSALPG